MGSGKLAGRRSINVLVHFIKRKNRLIWDTIGPEIMPYSRGRFSRRGAGATSKPVDRGEGGFRPCAHADVVGQVNPADCAGGIDEEFGGSRDVVTRDTGFGMEYSVLANRLSVGVRKEWKRIPSRLAELL